MRKVEVVGLVIVVLNGLSFWLSFCFVVLRVVYVRNDISSRVVVIEVLVFCDEWIVFDIKVGVKCWMGNEWLCNIFNFF